MDPAHLGITMIHEHLAPRAVVPSLPDKPPFAAGQTYQGMVSEVHRLQAYDVRTIVDVTPNAKGRDPDVLRRIADQTGINIVAATGFYKEPSYPPFVHQATLDNLVRFMMNEITHGIDGTDVRPGIIKVGSSKGVITPTEAKVLRAAAVVHRETGLPLTTHCTLGTMGREQMEIFLEHDVDPSRVIIGHSDLNNETLYHSEILKTGATVAFDTIGKERFQYVCHHEAGYERYAFLLEEYHISDNQRLTNLLKLINDGFASQLVLSSDITWGEAVLNPATIGSWGYSYLWAQFIPRLKAAGVEEHTLSTMLIANPCRILAGMTGSSRQEAAKDDVLHDPPTN
jgi:phosphotriesterase-related protein